PTTDTIEYLIHFRPASDRVNSTTPRGLTATRAGYPRRRSAHPQANSWSLRAHPHPHVQAPPDSRPGTSGGGVSSAHKISRRSLGSVLGPGSGRGQVRIRTVVRPDGWRGRPVRTTRPTVSACGRNSSGPL